MIWCAAHVSDGFPKKSFDRGMVGGVSSIQFLFGICLLCRFPYTGCLCWVLLNVFFTLDKSDVNMCFPFRMLFHFQNVVSLSKCCLTFRMLFRFQNIVLEENTMGRDGQEYVLRCSIDGPTLKLLGSTAALSYDIPFLFYNGQSSHFVASFILSKVN